jgi:hypothetical protein
LQASLGGFVEYTAHCHEQRRDLIWGFWSLAVACRGDLILVCVEPDPKMDRSMPQCHVHVFVHLALAN